MTALRRRGRAIVLVGLTAVAAVLLWLFVAAAALTSLNSVCTYGAPPSATSTRQTGELVPPSFACIYQTADGVRTVDRRDGAAWVRAVGVVVAALLLGTCVATVTRAVRRDDSPRRAAAPAADHIL